MTFPICQLSSGSFCDSKLTTSNWLDRSNGASLVANYADYFHG